MLPSVKVEPHGGYDRDALRGMLKQALASAPSSTKWDKVGQAFAKAFDLGIQRTALW